MMEYFCSGMSGLQIGETLKERVLCLPVYAKAPTVTTMLREMLWMMFSDALRPHLTVDVHCCAVFVCDFKNRVRWADLNEAELARFMSSSAFLLHFGICGECIYMNTKKE
jgi:hypothetical protein